MTWLLSLVLGLPRRLWAVVAGAGVALAVILGAYSTGRRNERQRASERAMKDYQDTRRRINDVEMDGNDPDAAARWLRERGKSGRDL